MNEVAIWWEVSAGRKLTCREEMVSLLKTKFSRKSNSLYIFRIYIKLFIKKKKMGFPSCRTEQLLQGKRLKEKEDKEEKHIRKLFRKNSKKNAFHYPKLKVI